MKVIIAGSRDITDRVIVAKAILESRFNFTEVVSGTARGVDRLGEIFACSKGYSVKKFPANWTEYGKAAGHIRNREMAQYADALLAVWDGKSRGTKNMIEEMEKLGKPVHIYFVKGNQ